jgi:hypothetical protein
LSSGALTIQTSKQNGQSGLKTELDAKKLVSILFKDRRELNASVKRVADVVTEEISKPAWIELGKEILQIEGDVAPEIEINPPSDWQQTLKDLSNGKLNVIYNGEIINLSIDEKLSASEDEIVVRATGFKGLSSSLPTVQESATMRAKSNLEQQLDAVDNFWNSPLPFGQEFTEKVENQFGVKITSGNAILGSTLAFVSGSYIASYNYYLSEIEAAEKEAAAKRKQVAEKKKAAAAKKKAENGEKAMEKKKSQNDKKAEDKQIISAEKKVVKTKKEETKDNKEKENTDLFSTVFDFTDTQEGSMKSVDSFERIDDAIMGGISLSSLKFVENKPYASWSGVCRTDGGGFCGMRTLPLREPISIVDKDGIFLDCRLNSDNEPECRVWKVTLRSDTSRGEQVYQAAFEIPKRSNDNILGDDDSWSRVKIPFESFQLVRGPRLVVEGPKFDTSAGVYQIGVTLSKFVIGVNTTEVENFRPGYFDLQYQRIGFYEKTSSDTTNEMKSIEAPGTLTKEESNRKRPILLKILLPVTKLLFSEKARRRRSAMNILKEKRGMNRAKVFLFGLKSKSKSIGFIPSIAKTLSIIGIDAFRFTVFAILRVFLFYPLKLVRNILKTVR